MTRVLVLAGEVVPLPGLPTNGGGLRGWTLARGLESAGFDVVLRFPQHALDALGATIDPAAREAALAHTFEWHDAASTVASVMPDVVVCCSWLLAAHLGPCPVPLAVDVAGPVLLEFLYQDVQKAIALAPHKPRGLALADFVTCAGERQRGYFYPWLLLAGFDQEACASRLATVPISAAPDTPLVQRANDEPVIVFAGSVVPWHDPLEPLLVLVDTLRRVGRGRLVVYAMTHPVHSHGATWFTPFKERVAGDPRVMLHEGARPYEELRAVYSRADLAFDLFARNPERELAFPTRTVDYLAAGLPVLTGSYSELAGLIADYDAGFIVAPTDWDAIVRAVAQAVTAPDRLLRQGANARRLVDEQLVWTRTITPLAAWCAAPMRRQPSAFNYEALAPELPVARQRIACLVALAAEREAYTREVEAAWAAQGQQLAALDAAHAAWRRAPWRSAWRQLLAQARRRVGRIPGNDPSGPATIAPP